VVIVLAISSLLRLLLGIWPGVCGPLDLDPFSNIEADITPVVAILNGRGLRGWVLALRLTPDV